MMFKCGLIAAILVVQCIAVEVVTKEINSSASSVNQNEQIENMNAYDKTLLFFGNIIDDAKDVYSNIIQEDK
jgi:hypothetical protein